MRRTGAASRPLLGAASLATAGVLFLLFPVVRPWADEGTLVGAAAFASSAWVASHAFGMFAFALLPLGMLALWRSLAGTSVARPAYAALVVSVLGVGLTLPFFRAEAFGLQAIGAEAVARQDVSLLEAAEEVRAGTGVALFGVGLLLIAAAGVLAGVTLWRSGSYPGWSGVLFAITLALYLPQFYLPPAGRIAHGVLLALACLWVAISLWRHDDTTARPSRSA